MEPSSRQARPKAKTPAERSVEFAAVQRRLKEEAAARRQQASKSGAHGDAGRTRRGGTGRRTP